MLHRSGVVPDRDLAERFLASQDGPLALEAVRAEVGASWHTELADALYGEAGEDGRDEGAPSALHEAVAALAVERGPQTVHLFTLNLDGLLAEALRQVEEGGEGRPVQERSTGSGRAPDGHHEVQHLHGRLLPDGTALDPVLTTKDYEDVQAGRPWQAAELQVALQRGAAHRCCDESPRPGPPPCGWASCGARATTRGSSSSRVSRSGSTSSSSAWSVTPSCLSGGRSASRCWSSRTTTTFAQLLQELSYPRDSEYLSPRDRARRFWSSLSADFTSLQTMHAEQLHEDLSELRSLLGEESNLTLWVADGRKNLVRWCSHDRTYRGPDLLRRVPLRHAAPGWPRSR